MNRKNFSLLTFSIILMFNPLISVSKKRAEQKNAHKCIALLNLSLLLGCLSLLNFSLAISLTVIYVPIVSLVNSNFDTVLSKVRKVTSYLCLTLLHPLAFSYLCLLGLSFYSDSRSGIFHHFFRTFYAHKKILFFFVWRFTLSKNKHWFIAFQIFQSISFSASFWVFELHFRFHFTLTASTLHFFRHHFLSFHLFLFFLFRLRSTSFTNL